MGKAKAKNVIEGEYLRNGRITGKAHTFKRTEK